MISFIPVFIAGPPRGPITLMGRDLPAKATVRRLHVGYRDTPAGLKLHEMPPISTPKLRLLDSDRMGPLHPKAILFDIGSTLWSSPAEDQNGLNYCYDCGREALITALSDVPERDILIEAVEGYFAEWEERRKTDATLVEQRPTADFVAEALLRVGVTAPVDARLAAQDLAAHDPRFQGKADFLDGVGLGPAFGADTDLGEYALPDGVYRLGAGALAGHRIELSEDGRGVGRAA